MFRGVARAASSLVPLRPRREPFLNLPMLSALCVGAPTALWMSNSGFAWMVNSSGVLALVAAPATTALVTTAAAAAGLGFVDRIAELPPAERIASDTHARELLYATLVAGTIVAATCHTPLDPDAPL